jgi:hypothetical protein
MHLKNTEKKKEKNNGNQECGSGAWSFRRRFWLESRR